MGGGGEQRDHRRLQGEEGQTNKLKSNSFGLVGVTWSVACAVAKYFLSSFEVFFHVILSTPPGCASQPHPEGIACTVVITITITYGIGLHIIFSFVFRQRAVHTSSPVFERGVSYR